MTNPKEPKEPKRVVKQEFTKQVTQEQIAAMKLRTTVEFIDLDPELEVPAKTIILESQGVLAATFGMDDDGELSTSVILQGALTHTAVMSTLLTLLRDCIKVLDEDEKVLLANRISEMFQAEVDPLAAYLAMLRKCTDEDMSENNGGKV